MGGGTSSSVRKLRLCPGVVPILFSSEDSGLGVEGWRGCAWSVQRTDFEMKQKMKMYLS